MAMLMALALALLGGLLAVVGVALLISAVLRRRRAGGHATAPHRTALRTGAVLIPLGLAGIVASPFVYAALNDPEPPVSRGDVDTDTPGQIVVIGSDAPSPTTDATDSPTTVAATPTEPAAPTPTASETPEAAGTSTWAATDASIVGYRVKEILFGVDTEAVGRTNQVAGQLTFEDTTLVSAEFTIDMTSVESDDSRRDNQFRGNIMSVDEFPTATFVLTEPIATDAPPSEGATLAATATGELTLRGVTNPVSFDIEADVTNGQIVVVGNIPIVFADYGIANPSRSGITTEDNGLLEFALVFTQTG